MSQRLVGRCGVFCWMSMAAASLWVGGRALAFSAPSLVTSRRVTTKPSSTELSMAGKLTLYGSQGSRSPLVNWAAYELGLDLTMGDLNNNPHPFGQIPCMTDDNDVTIFESGAILLYLHSKSEAMQQTLTPQQQGDVLSWVAWANASLDPICFLETPQGKVYDTGLKQPNRRIDRLNQLLQEQAFLVSGGDVLTVADVAVAAYLLYVVQFFPGINLSRWPHMVRYMTECASRPAYAKAFGKNVQAILVAQLESMTV